MSPDPELSRDLDFHTALEIMRLGHAVARAAWEAAGNSLPMGLVFIPGRRIKASFEPMVRHLGRDAEFTVHDHIDALFEGGGAVPEVVVGWSLSQDDLLANDWFMVP